MVGEGRGGRLYYCRVSFLDWGAELRGGGGVGVGGACVGGRDFESWNVSD